MSRTKITLEEPYASVWRRGYLVTNSENRRTLILYNSSTDRSSCQYARYLLAVKIGRFLTAAEEADHIDGDKTNDSVANLQVLSKAANIRKSAKGIQITQHGTLSMHRYCKCTECKEAKRAYNKAYALKRVTQAESSTSHQESLLQ